MDTTRTVLRSAKYFFAGTLVSRVSGLLRDIAMAVSFGSSPEIAAFMVSYRLANLFRRLLGEGNLNSAFVPHFTEMKERGGYFYRDVLFSMGVILMSAVALLEAFLWGLRSFVGPNWLEIVNLTMWMVPGLFFICLYGLNSSLLQCRKKYFIPAVAPVAFNLIWVASVLWIPDVRFLALSITLAFAGQWFVTIFEGMRLLTLKEWLQPCFFSADFKRLIKPLILGIVGIGAVQFNSALDTIFARFADLKGPAYLWYAIRVQQLPLALFGLALTGALLPPLSRAIDPKKREELLENALKYGMTLMLICTFGIFALSDVGINLLFGHGDFGLKDVLETSRCLSAYAIGLAPAVLVLILAANCYSQKNYWLPSIASFAAVGANVFFNALFVFGFGWGAVSVAVATSISSIVNCVILSKGAFSMRLWNQFLRVSLAGLATLLITTSVQHFWLGPLSADFLGQVTQFLLLTVTFLGAISILTWKRDLKELLEHVR